MGSEDPSEIRSIAVTVDDVLAAFEANRQRDAGAVLRVTPPFAGRMRARLHRVADDLRNDPDETYSRERHREYHAAAVGDWRGSARDAVVDSVVLDSSDGPTEVSVTALG